MPAVKSPKTIINEDGYSIGYNNGCTIMKVKCEYNTITLSLPREEVLRMIRLLEASLDEAVMEGENE